MAGIKSHFVPQFYLKNFGESIFFFDKKRAKIHQSSPKNIAHKSNFYGPMIAGDHPLESAFSQIEGESNTAIKDLIENEDVGKLSEENFVNLCKFVALQYVRTEEKRNQIEEGGNFVLQELFAADHPEFDRELIERLHVTDELTLRVHLKAIAEYTKIAAVIHQMKKIIIINKTSFPFWTSDNPVGLYNSVDFSPFSGLGIIVEGIEMHIPINPKLQLVICDPVKFKNYPDILETDSDFFILTENWIQTYSSTRFVFSNTKRFYKIKNLLKEQKHLTDPKRKRNDSSVIIGSELNKNSLRFWANQKTQDLLKTDRNEEGLLPFRNANPNSEYVLTGFKHFKSKYDSRLSLLKY